MLRTSKRVISIILILLLSCGLVNWNMVFADASTSLNEEVHIATDASYFKYSISSEGVTITGLNNAALSEIIIPEVIENQPVVSIGGYAFAGNENLTKVIVPSTVTSIGNHAFYQTNLTEIELPFIGKSATTSKENESVFGYIFGYTFREGRTVKDEEDIENATYQCYIYNPNASNVNLRYTAYYYYIPTTLKNVTITNAIDIPKNAFYGCSMLEEIHVEEGTSTLGSSAFENCSNLKKLYLPDSLNSIKSNTYKNCSVLSIFANEKSVAYLDAKNQGINAYSTASLVLDQTEKVLYKGNSCILQATATMLNGSKKDNPDITWSTSDSNVVTVNSGVVTVTGPGTATVSANYEGHTATCEITVFYSLEDIAFSEKTCSIDIGKTKKLEVVYTPTNTTDNKTLSWESSDERIVSVDDNGVITAVSKGTAVVTATHEKGFTISISVTVTVPIESLVLNKTSLNMEKGETQLLKLAVTPEDTTDTYKWTSTNTSVATIDESGCIKAVGVGTAKIKVITSRDMITSCDVRVSVSSSDIQLSYSEKTLFIDEEFSLDATLKPSDSTDSISWKSSNEDVIVVNSEGLCTPTGVGDAIVTATTTSGVSASCVISVNNEIENASISLTSTDFIYNGTEIKPIVSIISNGMKLIEGTDYQTTYNNNLNVGIGTVHVQGIGRYSGASSRTFNISKNQLGQSNVTVTLNDETYTGSKIIKNISVNVNDKTLIENKDYQIRYTNNINVGKATLKIIGIGNYTGEIEHSFNIVKAPQDFSAMINVSDIKIGSSTKLTVNGVGNIRYDYDENVISISNGIVKGKSVGQSKIVITAAGNDNYSSAQTTIIVNVYCNHESGEKVRIEYKKPTCIYDGHTQETYCSTCNVVLKESSVIPATKHKWNTSYTVDKKATCVNFGSKSKHCLVCNVMKESSIVSIPALGHDYVRTIIKTSTIKNGKIVDKCNICKNTKETIIYRPSKITLDKTSVTYTGKQIHPSVSIKNSNGKFISASNYTVKYSNGCKNVGKYTVTVTFKGNYSGKLTKQFEIVKASQKITAKDKSLTVGGSKISLGAKRTVGNGSLSYASSNKKIATVSSTGKITPKAVGKTTITITAKGTNNYKKATKKITVKVNPKGVSLSSVKSPKGGQLVVKWKKSSAVTGYQIRYSRESDMDSYNTKTISSKSTTEKKITGLKQGKKYYIQVRTYKKVNGIKYYSSWSKKKSVTICNNFRITVKKATVHNSKKLTLKVQGGSGKITWSSSNKKIATVSSKGVVTGLKAGTCTITATRNGVKSKCTITVPNKYKENSTIYDYGALYGLRVVSSDDTDNDVYVKIYHSDLDTAAKYEEKLIYSGFDYYSTEYHDDHISFAYYHAGYDEFVLVLWQYDSNLIAVTYRAR